ncbi:MAG: hypothetical protein RJA17_557, partial [Pseudomonadota bacterium]
MAHDTTYSLTPLGLSLSLLPGESTELYESESWDRSYLVIDVEGATPLTSLLFNGKGGSDNIYGSSLKDYIWIEGNLSESNEVWGSHGLGYVYASAGAGDDVFRLYTNTSGMDTQWAAGSSFLDGGNGTDTLFINGEWDSSWNLTALNLTSVETLALAWYPQATAPLEVRLTGQQWSQLQTIHVDVAHDPYALTIFVDGSERIDWQTEKIVVNTSISGFDYSGDAAGHVLGTSGYDNLSLPVSPIYIQVSGTADPGRWGSTTPITLLGGNTPDLSLPMGSSMDSRIFRVESDVPTLDGSY